MSQQSSNPVDQCENISFRSSRGIDNGNVASISDSACEVNDAVNRPTKIGYGLNNGQISNPTSDSEVHPDAIAICGLAMRLPGGIRDADTFWSFLVNGRDAKGPIPMSRYNPEGFDSRLGRKGAIDVQVGYFLDEDLEGLDSSFFSMSGTELGKTDPQQRQILEVTRECLESAGEVDYRGKPIGCYVGTFGDDWLQMSAKDSQYSGRYLITGHSDLMIANRVSYEYDFCGPSMVIKTGCSASLISLHEACRALQSGDCSAAIVAGTNLILGPTTTSEMTQEGILSPQGSCRTFDAAADGFARAEAVNAVYIKKLDDAIRDKNPIRAVIRNTAVNSDGKNSSIMQPNGRSHELLMQEAYRVAGLDPSLTAFVECHGTGTSTGDPIEARAVGNVFGERGLLIGSVKPNIGHSEGASGLSSLIKAVLALERKIIPPNIKFDVPNPKIPFKEKNLKVPIAPTPWPANRAFRVSINSFGIGGANAHVILDSATEHGLGGGGPIEEPGGHTRLLLLSANTRLSLQHQVAKTLDYIKRNPERITDLIYTLAIRREYLPHRAYALIGKDNAESISSYLKVPAKTSGITMIFSGQGAQWPGMGAELLETNAGFRDDIRSMDNILQSTKYPPQWTIEDELQRPSQTSKLHRAELAQPVSTALQIGLVNALGRCGVRPTAVIGHSSGEIAAAYACGILSLRAALVIAYYRGFITKGQNRSGGMAAIGLGARDVSSFLFGGVVIACENSENSTTISGNVPELEKILARIREERPVTLIRRLKVDVAYHSSHMKPLGIEYQRLIEEEFQNEYLMLRNTEVPFYSSVTTECVRNAEILGPQYWVSNLVSPVLFKSAVSNAIQSRHKDVFLEIGPHSTLAGPLESILSMAGFGCPYVSTMLRGTDSEQTLLSAFGQLYQYGVVIDFEKLSPPGKVLTDLPTYSWDHSTTFWYELQVSRDWRFRKFGHHSLLGLRVPETTDIEPCWRNALSIEDEIWLYDHRIQKNVVFPFAGYCAMAGEAIRQITGIESGFSLSHVVAHNAMMLTDSKAAEIRTTLRPYSLENVTTPESWKFVISSYSDSGWVVNCEGRVKLREGPLPVSLPPRELLREIQPSKWYDVLAGVGIIYGSHFRCLSSIKTSVSENVAIGKIRIPDSQLTAAFLLHPCTIDACLQLATVALTKGLGRNFTKLSVPTMIKEIDITRAVPEMTVMALSSDGGRTIAVECVANDLVVLRLAGVQMTQLDDETNAPDTDHYAAAELEWRPHFDFIDHSALFLPPSCNVEKIRLREEAALLCMIDSAERLGDLETQQPHMLKFQDWIGRKLRQAQTGEYPILDKAKEFLTLTKSGRMSIINEIFLTLSLRPYEDAVMEAIRRVWESVENIFTGDKLALDVLVQDDLLTWIYSDSSFDHYEFIRTLSHTKPSLSILEVGAGTGGITQTFLKEMVHAGGHPSYKLYTFTDISDGFFLQAKERFSYAPNMEFKVFDISQDPFKQGFEAESYDLILAANVVHATPVLMETLKNLRPLLTTNGSLVLTELSTTTSAWNYIFGTLPGWWLGEADGRSDEPYVSVDRWDRELKAAGFTGVDTAVYDAEQPYQYCSAIVTRPNPPAIKVEQSREVVIICDSQEEEIVRLLIASLTGAGYSISMCKLGEALPLSRNIISTIDLEGNFWENISKPRFLAFQNSLRSHTSQKLLWLTWPSQISCRNPRSAQAIGVARTIRSELGIPFYTLEIDPRELHFAALVQQIFENVQATEDTESLLPDREFVIHKGTVHIGRYYPVSVEQRTRDFTSIGPVQVKTLNISKLGFVRRDLSWTQEPQLPQIGDDYIEIEVRAAGLDFAHTSSVQGTTSSRPDNVPYSHELAGLVRRIGSNVENVSIGDRVMALWPAGNIASHVTLLASLIAKIPDHMNFEEAASLPTSFVTATRSLIDVGRLTKRQSVLIHLAASCLGHAVIQICRAVGAEVYATVDNEEEAQYLMDNYGLLTDHMYQTNNEFYVAQLLRDTGGHGVDIVLSSPRRELLQSSWKCVAEFGKFIDLGAGDLSVLDKLEMQLFLTNRSYCCVNLAHLIRNQPTEIRPILERYLDWQRQGNVTPIRRVASFAASEINAKFLSLRMSDTIGKTIIRIPEDLSKINATPKHRNLSLDPEAAYLLTGGLGGLGRSLATWFVEHGARTLVVLSRSAGTTLEAKKFFAELASLSCSIIAVTGNVRSVEDVERAVAIAGRPIKGVVHLAMVLKDAPILEMSHIDWTAAIEPKVRGAWSLHNGLMNQPLDFFFLASSLFTVIEHPGQGNYNAANAFLEAFCQYRHHLGLPASVLNICPIDGIGFFATNPKARVKMMAQGFHFLGEQAFLDCAELSLLYSHPAPVYASMSPCSAWKNSRQIFMGLRSELHLDNPKNRASWRRDRRMAIYHNVGALNGAEHASDCSKLKELLFSAKKDPSLMADQLSAEVLAYAIGKKVLEYRLRPEEDVDTSLSLVQMGMDSLKAIELRRWWKQTFGLEIHIFEIMQSQPVEQLGRVTADEIRSRLEGEKIAG